MGVLTLALVAVCTALGAVGSSLVTTNPALAGDDTTAPSPFDMVADAGEFQTGYSVASPYNNIYVSWKSTVDDTSPVSYEMTVNGVLARVVTDVGELSTITKRIEVPDGSHLVAVVAVDAAGNRRPASQTLDVIVDGVPPEFTSFPLLMLRRGQVSDDGYPMRYTWTATDEGTGLAQVRIGPGPDCCFTTGPEQTSYDFTVPAESSVAWRLWLYDGVGSTTKTVRDGYVSTVPWRQTDFSDGWRRQEASDAIDGSEWLSTRVGDRVKATTEGRSIAWVTTTGPTRGRADVLLNGRVVDTVSLYSAKRHSGRVIWVGKLPRNTSSTVAIVNRSGNNRTVVGVDALLLQR